MMVGSPHDLGQPDEMNDVAALNDALKDDMPPMDRGLWETFKAYCQGSRGPILSRSSWRWSV